MLRRQDRRAADADRSNVGGIEPEAVGRFAQRVDRRMELPAAGIRLQADAMDLELFARRLGEAGEIGLAPEQANETVSSVERLCRHFDVEAGKLRRDGDGLGAIAAMQPFEDRGGGVEGKSV